MSEKTENVIATIRAKTFHEAAEIVADCRAQGLGLDAAERALIREAGSDAPPPAQP